MAWRVPKGATFVVEAKGSKTIAAPSGLIGWVGRRLGRTDQLAALTQGPPDVESVRPMGRAAGVGKWEEKKWNHLSTIYLKEQVILQATKETESYMIITHIDLTPFGLEIKGDISSLRIGGHQMVGNTFENVETMVDVK